MTDVLIVGDSIRNPEIRHEATGAGLEVHAFERFGRDELQRQGLNYDEILREVAVRVCAELGVESAVVPPDFPLEVADRLRESGVDVKWDRPFFIARRRVKNEAELAGIRRAQRACEAAMEEARALLRRAERSNGV